MHIKHLLIREKDSNLVIIFVQAPLPEQEGSTDGIELDIEALSTKEIAYHITLFDSDLFWAVHEFELLYQTFGKHLFGKV